VSSWDYFDLGVTWSGIKNLKIGALLRNVTDKAAPYDPNNDTEGGALGFNPSFHNPYGRLSPAVHHLQVQISQPFGKTLERPVARPAFFFCRFKDPARLLRKCNTRQISVGLHYGRRYHPTIFNGRR
jgi:hypothetical protein